MKEKMNKNEENEIKEREKKKEGMTIIEVVLSFTVALILIMALWSIVYWGSITFSDVNQELIDVGNASIFIKTELTQNAGKYFYLDPIPGKEGEFNLMMKTDAPREIFNLINSLGYNRYNEIREVRIRDPQRINNTNLYKVEVEILFEHKNLRRVNKIEVYLTANSFKVGLIQPEVPIIDVGTFTIVSPATKPATNNAGIINFNINITTTTDTTTDTISTTDTVTTIDSITTTNVNTTDTVTTTSDTVTTTN
ncbi:MAG: hypothetical protein ACPL1F_07305 [bacterium]